MVSRVNTTSFGGIRKILGILGVISIGIVLLLASLVSYGRPAVSSACFKNNYNAFECELEKLLQISADDILRGEGGKSKLDIEGRKKFFSEGGWKQYQDFVASHKVYLKSKPFRDGGTPWHSQAGFTRGSQKYGAERNGLKNFSAEGMFSSATYDSYSDHKPFKIEISYSEKKTESGDKFLIEKWQLTPDPPNFFVKLMGY
jgi:hypothetical protein